MVAPAPAEPAAPAAFDYSPLAKPDRLWLRRAAAGLRARLRRTVREIVAAGRELARARRRLGRGQWEPWLAAEAQVPVRSATRLARVGVVFGAVKPEVLDRFTGTALYVLAEPGTPQALREFCVEQAAGGEEVTAGAVREWLRLYRDTGLAGTREASKSETRESAYDADEVHAPENWRAINAILRDAMLHLTHTSDDENGDGVVSGTLTDAAGRRRCAAAPTLEGVVLALSETVRQKECPRCEKVKRLDEFSRRSDKKDGRNRYCLECERVRVKTYAREKAAAARARAAGASAEAASGTA